MPTFSIELQDAVDENAVIDLQLGDFIKGNDGPKGEKGDKGDTGDVTPAAESARDAALAAQAAAEAAEASATSSAASATASASSASTSASNASSSASSASTSATNAANSATSSGTSASNAASSASSASTSATNATNSATAASASATTAGTAATNASNSATSAASSASAAATSATNAANSATDAANAIRGPSLIINPHGSIQQETTTPVTTGTYFADQWTADTAGTGFAFQAGVTTGTVSSYDPSYMFQKTTTAKGSLAAGDFLQQAQIIEGNNLRRLLYGGSAAKGSWIRWRASASQSGTASISIRNAATNRSFVQSFAVTTTPTDYSLFVPGDTTGTWQTTNVAAAFVSFCHASGTTFKTSTLGAWQAGNFIAANTQSNMLDTVNRQLNITDVQWTDSPILLPFVPIDYANEVRRCQRYWEAGGYSIVFPSYVTAQTQRISVGYKVTKRATPTVAINTTYVAGTNNPATNPGGSTDYLMVQTVSNNTGSVENTGNWTSSARM